MSKDTIQVVQATEQDIPDILKLIQELAVYEKEPDAVTATPELIKENVFVKKYAECLLAKDGDEVVGMALYFFNFSTWLGQPGLYLEDLYVTESRRHAGIGKLLFGHLGRIARERKCGRIEWRVLTWNEPSIAFYEKRLGAHPQNEWLGERLEGEEEIARLEAFLQ
ncbi:Peroxygenase 1 [Naganishia albida]|nr:Peroxygenase 1 [Naganishia albida]